MLGGMVQDGSAAPDWRFFVVPRADYRTVDNWQVAGLQGTGSIDVVLEDVFVPGYRTQRMQDNFQLRGAGQASNTSSFYRLRSAKSSCAASPPPASAPCTLCWPRLSPTAGAA